MYLLWIWKTDILKKCMKTVVWFMCHLYGGGLESCCEYLKVRGTTNLQMCPHCGSISHRNFRVGELFRDKYTKIVPESCSHSVGSTHTWYVYKGDDVSYSYIHNCALKGLPTLELPNMFYSVIFIKLIQSWTFLSQLPLEDNPPITTIQHFYQQETMLGI